MAKSVVGIEARVDTAGAEASVKSLKAQLREAQADVQALSEKFGASSAAAVEAAKKAAGLKNAISDAKSLTDVFNPDKKFQAFSSAIQSVVGGFAALQGAQALFGSESEDLQKVLAKVQAAMSLNQGINSIIAAEGAFKKLGIVIKTNVVGAFSSMKAAIASTGIGLLIIGIGLLVEKFMSMSSAAEKAAEAQEKLNERIKKGADIGLKAEQSYLNREEKLAIARAKLAGKSEDEIFKIQQDYRGQKLRSQERYYNEIKNVDANAASETLATIKDGIAEGQAAELDNQAKLKKIREDAAKEKSQKQKDNAQKEIEEIKQANEKAAQEIKSYEDEIFLLKIKDEDDRAREKLKQDYDNKKKEIEQSKANEILKNLELSELKKKFQLDSDILENEIKDKKLKADLEKQKQIDSALTEARLASIKDENFKKQQLIEINRQTEIDKQADAYNNGLINLQQYNEAIAGINFEFDKQQLDFKKQIADEQTKIAEDQKNKELAILEEKQKKELAIAQSISDGINFYKSLIDLNLQDVTNAQQKENDIQKQLLDDNKITKEQYEENIAAINDKAEKKKRQLQRQSIIAENAMTIANIILNTLQANAKALVLSPATFGQPWVGFNTASGILGVATTIAQTAKALSALGGGSAGGASASFSPNRGAPLSPQASSTNLNQAQVNQLASATTRAFVLESDVSGNQERIRRINRAARIN